MLKKPKILVVGSFVMDLIASAPRVPNLGETVIGTDFNTAPGGKGINQAVQCARLGADVTMVGCVGSDLFGKELLETAKESGVDVSHVKITDRKSSAVGHIQLEVKENSVQNRILVVPGANYELEISDLDWLKDEIQNYDLLILQLELLPEVTEAAAIIAHKAGVPVMLNPAPAAELSKELLECVTYLSPNEFEAALISGRELKADDQGVNEDDLKEVVKNLQAKGVDKVMVTLGSNGSVIADGKTLKYTDCVTMPNVKDPTAAGDSFVGAFCTGLTAGLPEKEALAFASHTAAITVSGMGAMPSLPTIDQVQALMKERDYQGFDLDSLNDLK